MRKVIHIAAILFVAFMFQQEAKAQSFYDLNTIQTIEITFDNSNWDFMLDTAKAGSDGYIMAQSVKINGEVFDSVGVKYKGNSSYNPNYKKNPFHIELDTYKEQDYQGYKDIKLSNVAKDPSFLREVISYAILRKHMIAPQSNFAKVYVNGELIGLYVNSESIGKSFVKKNFNSKKNSFFKCNPIDGAGPGTTYTPNLEYLGEDSTFYYSSYEMKSDNGWKELIKLCYTLENDIDNIENILDVDKALWMLAFDNVLVNLDSYIGAFTQNYYLYQDDSGKFNCIVWDLNESFGTFSQTGTINLPNTYSKSRLTPLLHENDDKWPLVKNLLNIPRYKKMYLAHVYSILNESISNNYYYDLGLTLQNLIDSSVKEDPNKFYTYEQFKSNLTTDVGDRMTSAPGIKALMDERANYLLSLSDYTSSKPVISDVKTLEQPQSILITAKVVNADTNSVYLALRKDNERNFTKIRMFDDGKHGDSLPGDNIYGTGISLNSSGAEYYLYAENKNIATFLPENAEFEFFTISSNAITSGNILLNEIYSRGTSDDPDWVELYNTSDQNIDISGYKIYDDGGKSGSKPKMEIPEGTVIPSNGFFVIVTDDTLSSSFGLSKSGETIWLENSSGEIVDSVYFPSLLSDESYGRIPDGGSWQILSSVTKGESNSSPTGVEDDFIKLTGYKLNQNYPNPFNPSTTISFSIPENGNVYLIIFNSLGQHIETLVNNYLTAGSYNFTWDASNYANGVYFYKLVANSYSKTKKMILLK